MLAVAAVIASACSDENEPGLQLTAVRPSPPPASADGDWRGTFAGTVTWDCGPIGERTGRLTGEFKIATPEKAQAILDGTNTITGSCGGPTEGTRTTPILVDGEVTEEGFEFPGTLWGPAGPFTIKVSGDRGSGMLEGPAPGPARVNLVFEIER